MSENDTTFRPKVPRDHRLHKRLSVFLTLNDEESEFIDRLQKKELRLSAGSDIQTEGNTYQFCYILKDGWAMSYKLLPDGNRQIVNFLLPGDFIGLRANWFKTAEVSIATLTDAIVSPVQPHRIITASRKFPRLGAAIAWSAARDESILIEHLVSLGRRSAYERIAHLILELRKRLEIVGFMQGRAFELPVTQEILGDFLGLSIVHVNRTLRKLRENGLIKQQENRIIILDLEGLEHSVGYDSGYLKQEKPPQKTSALVSQIEPSEKTQDKLTEIEKMEPEELKSHKRKPA